MPFTQGSHPIQIFLPEGSDEPFAEYIRLRALHGCFDHLRPKCASEASNLLEKMASRSWRIKQYA